MSEAVNNAIAAMMDHYKGDMKRISHFLKVHSLARMIGEDEGLDPYAQQVLELAAVVHDIGSKICEEKYGLTDSSLQEVEGPEQAGELLEGIIDDREMIERVKGLVSVHHTFDNVEGLDHRILLEADFIVSADEEGLSQAEILSGRRNIFRTHSGTEILNRCFALTSIYELPAEQRDSIEKFFVDRTDSCTTSYLDGKGGTAYVDDLSAPSAAAICMGEYLYLEGTQNCTDFYRDAFELAEKRRLTIITLDKKIRSLAQELYGSRCKKTIRYQMSDKPTITKKALSDNIATLPQGFEIVKINKELYSQALQNEWSQYFVKNYASYKEFEKNGRGYVVVYNGRIVCGTSSYSTCNDGYEIIIATHPAFRRKGFALICASRFILSCFKHGRLPHWDCANEKSFALSRKLGYTLIREYNGLVLY